MRIRLYFSLLFSLFLMSNSIAKKEKNTPVGVKLNKIINDNLSSLTNHMNKLIKSGPSENDLKKFAEDDKRIYKALIEGMKARNIRFEHHGDEVWVLSVEGKSTMKLVDYINGKFLVDGKKYKFDSRKSFKENLINAGNLFHKLTVFNAFFFIEDAHAFLPLLAIPGWAWLTAGAAGAVTFFGDTTVSAGLNDINNVHPEVKLRITELEKQYLDRANTCEADLAHARVSKGAELEGNNTIRMVGALIEGLGAELEDSFFDLDGKKEINYDDFGCEAYDGVDGIRNRQAVGVWSGFSPHGGALKNLCDNQERLNSCFKETEEVMKENAISVNDLPGPDRIGPYDGLLEDYVDIHNATSR